MINRYRKKPVEIEAVQYDGKNLKEIIDFVGNRLEAVDNDVDLSIDLYIKTLEGNMLLSKGDYVIKGVAGEFYPCKQEIFEKTYDYVSPKGKYEVIKCIKGCSACPSEWTVLCKDNVKIFINYRWGDLTLTKENGEEIYKVLASVGFAGMMTFEELKDLTNEIIDWRDCIEE